MQTSADDQKFTKQESGVGLTVYFANFVYKCCQYLSISILFPFNWWNHLTDEFISETQVETNDSEWWKWFLG